MKNVRSVQMSEKEFYKKLGHDVKVKRELFKRTQVEIAKLLNVTQGRYSKMERGILQFQAYHIYILERLGF